MLSALLGIFLPVVLLLLHAPLLARAQTCMDNYGLRSTASQQMITLLANQYTYLTNMTCAGGMRTAVYVSFTPTTAGNYYIRVPSTFEDLIMEIREGAMCEGSYFNCNGYLGDTTASVGFSSIALVGGQTYLILVSHRNSTALINAIRLEVGLVGTDTCTDNPMTSRTSLKYGYLSSTYRYSTTLNCTSGGVVSAQYTSFTPPTSGYYYVRAPYSGTELVVEIRSGSCSGSYVGCGGPIPNSPTSSAGFNSIYFTFGTTYVILVAGKYGGSVSSSSNYVEVDLVSSSGGSGGSSSNNGLQNGAGSMLLITILVPCVLFGLAFIIAMVLYCRGRSTKHHTYNAFASTLYGKNCLARIHNYAIATWLFSVLVCVTTWAVYWSSMTYIFALITLVLGAIIHRAASAPNFAHTHVAQNASKYKMALMICSRLLFLNVIVAIVNVTFLFIGVDGICTPSIHAVQYFERCLVYPVLGVFAALGMFALGVVAPNLGNAVCNAADGTKAADAVMNFSHNRPQQQPPPPPQEEEEILQAMVVPAEQHVMRPQHSLPKGGDGMQRSDSDIPFATFA